MQSIEFSFDHNSADQLEELRRLPGVNDAQKIGDKFKLYTLGPSLEDVFIRLTGLKRTGSAVHAIDYTTSSLT